MNQSNRTKIWLPLIVGFSIAVGVFIGNQYTHLGTGSGKVSSTKLDAVLGYINRSYVDTVDVRQLIEDALPHVVEELDPHSTYISAKEMKRVNEDLEGHFSGVGVSFYILNDTLVVTSIVPGGPSEAAGIMQWDRIVEVNDSLIAGTQLTNADVQKLLRGETGTEVKLGIHRAGQSQPVDITVTRGDIPMNSVQAAFMQNETTGYIKISGFGFNTFHEFIGALSKLKYEGAKGFVIDLRGNSGGSLEVAIQMINEFLNKGDLIVYAEGRSFPRQDNYANGSGTCKEDDIVVLIDEMSASASEIFAGAIQDHDRGLVIGRRSFGKGTVQSQRLFGDGSAVRLTVARYYTPSGRSIQRKYEKGKNSEYEMEALTRYLKGDYVNSDSLSDFTSYQTAGGRTVFEGDGIMPDIFMARDTVGFNSYYRSIVNKDYVQEYAMTYSDMYRHKLSEFNSGDELAEYLYRQPLLVNLTSYADNRGIRPRPYYIRESQQLFERQLISYVVRNFHGEEAFWKVFLQYDEQFIEAINLLDQKLATPQAVLTEQYKNKETKHPEVKG